MVTYLDELVVQYSPQSKTALAYNPRKELERQRATIEERRKRLIILFETGRIELDAYDIRLAELHREQSRIQHEINTLEEKDAREARLARNLDAIRASVPRTVLAGDPAEANRWLRNLIVKVWVDDRKVVNVEL